MKINAVYKISESPTIYASTGTKYWEQLPPATEGQAFMLCHPMWEFSWTSLRLYWRCRTLLKKKNIRLILLHNSESEYRFARRFGFESHLINQNIHACENKFKVQKGMSKKYHAVYTAAAKPYKRIHLAEAIEELFIITYFWPDVRDENGLWDLHAFEPRVSHANFNRTRIDAQEISQILNASYCGLALSAKEGAMWATMEYLMSGLPIVSTRSRGGRDFFFDPAYATVAADDPQAIKSAVDHWVNVKPDPERVRAQILAKIEPYRRMYYELCRELAESYSSFESYEDFRQRVWGNDGIAKLKIM